MPNQHRQSTEGTDISQKLAAIQKMYFDELQDNEDVHLRYYGLFSNHFNTNLLILFAGETIFEIGEQLQKLQAKCLIVLCAPFILHFHT